MYAAFKDGTVHQVNDEVLWRKNGTSFPVDYTSTPIWEDGQLAGAVVTFKDITDRRRQERELTQLHRQNQLILESAGEGIYGLDLEGNTTFVNPAAATMLGYQAEELLGVPMHDRMHHTKPDGTHVCGLQRWDCPSGE
jgi:PAS domain-containing protein